MKSNLVFMIKNIYFKKEETKSDPSVESVITPSKQLSTLQPHAVFPDGMEKHKAHGLRKEQCNN